MSLPRERMGKPRFPSRLRSNSACFLGPAASSKGKKGSKGGKSKGGGKKQNYHRPAKMRYKQKTEKKRWKDTIAKSKDCWVGGVGLRDAVMASKIMRCRDGVYKFEMP